MSITYGEIDFDQTKNNCYDLQFIGSSYNKQFDPDITAISVKNGKEHKLVFVIPLNNHFVKKITLNTSLFLETYAEVKIMRFSVHSIIFDYGTSKYRKNFRSSVDAYSYFTYKNNVIYYSSTKDMKNELRDGGRTYIPLLSDCTIQIDKSLSINFHYSFQLIVLDNNIYVSCFSISPYTITFKKVDTDMHNTIKDASS